MAWTREDFRTAYSRLAPWYDAGLWLYRLAGVRVDHYRRLAVEALALRPGDTVVDLGCGTGLNFPLLHAAVGEQGKIIGVDLTEPMLERARQRAEHAGWDHVELVRSDMARFQLPADTGAVLATLALGTIPDYEDVVARTAAALSGDARIAIFEMQWPTHWPAWLARFAAWLNRPAGVTPDLVERRPADAICKHFRDVRLREFYFGAVMVGSGRAPAGEQPGAGIDKP